MKRAGILFLVLVHAQVFPQTWPSVASCTYNWTCFQLSPSGNELYIGGQSDLFNSQVVNYICKWNGSSATALYGGMSGGNLPSVDAMTFYNNQLVAGGRFINAGSSVVNNIAVLNSSNWQGLGAGMNGTVSSLKVYNGELYAGGYFTIADTVNSPGIAKWNGTQWMRVGTGFTDLVSELETFNGELYVATNTAKIYKWDGINWTYLMDFNCNTPFCSPAIYCMKNLYNSQLYVGGYFDLFNNSTVPANNIARFDGNTWSAVGNASFMQYPTWDPVASMTEKNGMLYITGSFDSINNMFSNSFAMWNGVNWQTINSGPYDGACIEVFQGDIYVGARNNLRRLDSTLSVHEIFMDRIEANVFPVPAKERITFSVPCTDKIISISITDVSGKKIYMPVELQNYTADISLLQGGIYFFEAITEKQERFFGKLIKQ